MSSYNPANACECNHLNLFFFFFFEEDEEEEDFYSWIISIALCCQKRWRNKNILQFVTQYIKCSVMELYDVAPHADKMHFPLLHTWLMYGSTGTVVCLTHTKFHSKGKRERRGGSLREEFRQHAFTGQHARAFSVRLMSAAGLYMWLVM